MSQGAVRHGLGKSGLIKTRIVQVGDPKFDAGKQQRRAKNKAARKARRKGKGSS